MLENTKSLNTIINERIAHYGGYELYKLFAIVENSKSNAEVKSAKRELARLHAVRAEDELKFIADHWHKLSARMIADSIGRSMSHVFTQAAKLGLGGKKKTYNFAGGATGYPVMNDKTGEVYTSIFKAAKAIKANPGTVYYNLWGNGHYKNLTLLKGLSSM